MEYNAARALELLRLGSGRLDATFRDGQEEAIRHIVEGKERLLPERKPARLQAIDLGKPVATCGSRWH